MMEIKVHEFDIAQICESGQCFRMKKIDESKCEKNGYNQNDNKDNYHENRYQVIAGNRYLEVAQRQDRVMFSCTQDAFDSFWKKYFDLDRDYGIYISGIDTEDQYLTAAAEYGRGIRILHQDLWEMIISFLISQQNNIVRIRRCIENICRKYGTEMDALMPEMKSDGNEAVSGIRAFPTPQALASTTEEALRECNLGYRAKYVLRTARMVADGTFDLDTVKQMEYGEAKEKLLTLYGVGEKVADCICLFALHQLQAFPVDTHIRQVLDRQYSDGFPWERYQGIEGVMQQYIFYYDLHAKDRIGQAPN